MKPTASKLAKVPGTMRGKVIEPSVISSPRFATIDDWCKLSGMGRRSTYKHIADGKLQAVKVGSRTLINAEAGFLWLTGVPEERRPRRGRQPAVTAPACV